MSSAAGLQPRSWRRLIVLAPNWIGDAVMAEPSLRALHRAHPELEILAFGRTAAISAWRGRPQFASIEPLDDRGWLGPFRAGRRLRSLDADAVLLLRGSFRAALVGRSSGCPIRIGVDRDGRRPLLTHPLPRPDADGRPRPTVELYESLVAPLGVRVDDRTPCITPTPESRDAIAPAFEGLPRPLVGLVPGGSKPAKRWPPERFAELVARCGDRLGSVALFGSPAEKDVLDAVRTARRDGPEIVDLSSRGLRVDLLPAAIARCDALVTNDTGPRHLAIAQGVPTVSLFGPTDHRWTIVPGGRERMLLAEPFLDDDHVADRHPRACRMDRIPVGDACHALLATLEETKDADAVSSSST